MLTNQDLNKIGTLLDTKLGDLEKKMNLGFRKVRRELKLIVNFLDKQDVDLQKRVIRIEQHLRLPTMN